MDSSNLNTNMELLRNKSFVLICFARVSTTLASQMLAVIVGWQIYELTKSSFYLGLVGLVQFLPMVLLTLMVGHVADRYNRRVILTVCQFVEGAGVLALALGSYYGWLNKESILVIMFLFGTVHAFEGPTMQALMPNLVAIEHFSRAIAWATSLTQTAVIIGPALGGFLYVFGPTTVYLVISLLFLISSLFASQLQIRGTTFKRNEINRRSLFAGISFIRSKSELLGAISLDLFAVLLGGATALLPIYAQDIFYVGPVGLGILRAAPAVGALLMSAVLARHPLRERVGKIMFIAVIVFGIATIIFAVSTSFVLSVAALIVLGASDVISVVIRSSLVQLKTPDEMRGRVSAVNMLFVGTSNQLGEFESGLTASWFGTIPSVLIGGIGTIVVAVIWMRMFPKLLQVKNLE
ncbi:MFS transporter [Desulfosporosinus sp. OT]|uniref:MFS transporter n=1 Tax=Desulfosporosinus sp. OT TaxID=913865 RepID=UPI000223A788|nr:MFS transporter [Desulfosporosinus sp. OT]EGW38434.1 major Facilitator Superfamily protein [Desulfosporosinus sp. OT]